MRRHLAFYKVAKSRDNAHLITRQSPVILDLCLTKTRSRESHDQRDAIFFKKHHFKMFPVPTKTQSRHFKFARFEGHFENLRFRDGLVWTVLRFNCRNKPPFSWWISVVGRSNCRNKPPFSWWISVVGRFNRRNKPPVSWWISVVGRSNCRNKPPVSWWISVLRFNCRNKPPLFVMD